MGKTSHAIATSPSTFRLPTIPRTPKSRCLGYPAKTEEFSDVSAPAEAASAELIRDCATALLSLRCVQEGNAVDAESLRSRIVELVDAVTERARKVGLTQRDAVDMQYAVVATADETAARRGGAVAQVWMQRPLQMQYFNENVAGDKFFSRLEVLLGDSRRLAVLRVYYVCLLLGFEGRHAHAGTRMELDSITAKVREALGEWADPPGISLRAATPVEPRLAPRRRVPALWIAGCVALFAASVCVTLMASMDDRSDVLRETLDGMAPR
ncbi:MAG: DotU family type IV/VI secretion system protein [Myxococcales bacterium FL481]|nr:MAG: DotU family type IV/VI secretion system protein [Myxococcales bacterium FL481]